MNQVLIISSILLWVGLLLNFFLILGLLHRMEHLRVAPNHIETIQPGTIAPPFQASTLVDGNIVNQKAYEGRNVVFIVIGTSCSPCRDFMPYFLELIPLAQQHNVEIILISESDKKSTEIYLEEFNITAPTLIASKGNSNFLENYKVLSTPWFCLVNSQGKIHAAGYPGQQAEIVRKQILTLVPPIENKTASSKSTTD